MGSGMCLPVQETSVNKKDQVAVGANTNQISDDVLELALGKSAMDLKQKVILRFKCHNLPNLDKGSKSDAFCVLWLIDKQARKIKLGQTELIANNLNPEFLTEIVVNYFFEQQQNL